MGNQVSAPNVLREVHKQLGPGRKIPNSKVPKDGIDLEDALDPVLVRQFEETIKSDPKLSAAWEASYTALKDYAETHEFDGNPLNLSAQELVGANKQEVMDFKLVLSLLHLYEEKGQPTIQSFEVVGKNKEGHFVPMNELPGGASLIYRDPFHVKIDVKEAGSVTLRIGPIEKTFPVESGSNLITVLEAGEAMTLKRQQREIGIEVRDKEGKTTTSVTIPSEVRIGRNRPRPKPTPSRRHIM